MPENLKALRRRVKTINSTKQITRAMKMVSAAKLRRAQAVLEAGRPYAARLQTLLSYLAGSASVADHPLFKEREGDRRIMVVFTADRGLCGGFNNNLVKLVEGELKAQDDKDWQLYCVGKRGADYFKRRRWPVIATRKDLGGRPDLDVANAILDDLIERYTAGETDEIHLYYQSYVSLAVHRPVFTRFLNLDAATLSGEARGEGEPALDYILEPSADRVFDALLPRYMTSKIYITMAEVFTAEHSARMIAMSNATKNCDELGDQMTLTMNKARQTQITTELIDIVGGAEAV